MFAMWQGNQDLDPTTPALLSLFGTQVVTQYVRLNQNQNTDHIYYKNTIRYCRIKYIKLG